MTPPGELPGIEGWTISRGSNCPSRDEELRLLWADETDSLSILTSKSPHGEPVFVVRNDEWVQFTLCFAKREIWIDTLDDEVTDNTIAHLLVDQIWPQVLAHRGELVLHAAGVAVPSGAILFVGPSGRGKSTLAASLHQRGFALLGDDAMIISTADGEAECSAVYRSLRLFPDSIESLFDQPIQRTDVADYTDKENVHLPAPDQRAGTHRVRAIFFIGADDAAAGPSVDLISPGDACMRLVEHSFWLDPTDVALTAKKLSAASALAHCVPVFQLGYPRDYAKLGNLHAAIFAAVDAIG